MTAPNPAEFSRETTSVGGPPERRIAWRRRVLFAIAGAALGYAWYYFIGCRTGSCPITSNPWISTAYGAAFGLLLALDRRSPTVKTGENDNG